MANMLRNIIKMRGIAEKELYDDSGELDFNRLLPMPSSLDVDTIDQAIDNAVMDKRQQILSRHRERADLVSIQKEIAEELEGTRKITDMDYYMIGVYINNLKKYGFTTSYGWQLKNWGCTGNAFNSFCRGANELIFETRWSFPKPFVEKLAKKYAKEGRTECWYADEDAGKNTGHMVYEDGICICQEPFLPDSQDALRNFVLCWGDDADGKVIMRPDGRYHFKDEDGYFVEDLKYKELLDEPTPENVHLFSLANYENGGRALDECFTYHEVLAMIRSGILFHKMETDLRYYSFV